MPYNDVLSLAVVCVRKSDGDVKTVAIVLRDPCSRVQFETRETSVVADSSYA